MNSAYVAVIGILDMLRTMYILQVSSRSDTQRVPRRYLRVGRCFLPTHWRYYQVRHGYWSRFKTPGPTRDKRAFALSAFGHCDIILLGGIATDC